MNRQQNGLVSDPQTHNRAIYSSQKNINHNLKNQRQALSVVKSSPHCVLEQVSQDNSVKPENKGGAKGGNQDGVEDDAVTVSDDEMEDNSESGKQ